MKKRIIIGVIIAVVVIAGLVVGGGLLLLRPQPVVIAQPETASERVLTAHLGHFNIYFIQTDDGYILVDTGMAVNQKQLDEAFSKAGINPQDVKLIVITHGHADHIGNVAYAKELSGADVLCHEYVAPFLRDGKGVPAVAQTFTGKIFNALTPMKYPAVEPDVAVKEEFDLTQYGIKGKIIHTPGHSQGSITVLLDTGEMLLGDIVRGEAPEIHLGNFYEDKDALIQGLEMLVTYQPQKVYMSHGGSMDNAMLQTTIKNLKG